MSTTRSQPTWLILAVASGGCAAFNGVFAKLTTTELTASWAGAIAKAFSLDADNKVVEYAIRALFFALNLVFNAVMWGLFTRALTLASSTVRVSVINTSANFMITAVLGALIFSETLPGLWWVGASLLVAGSVIIGRREEGNKAGGEATTVTEPLIEGTNDADSRFKDEDEPDNHNGLELNTVNDPDGERSTDDEDATLK
ncbi:hypothetical protein BU24DRAFT_357316 [Aaosphaeria arxii CBS 175.79]|uniref:EamA domain-containing protein n=1 Tax=Aaosphaeria arxii CBS 175.79 TaxID=1450172 RepID=A0A6A5XAC0_9PLEO|nr:uncharacterized protein BU24DRAFT_357316 [Aaosphaeria arxii CBS 175.79]KAF2009902.1 hypothetical protein BU24DRAFT_357316 [Aaosphaeria arxii CBS 175.79]